MPTPTGVKPRWVAAQVARAVFEQGQAADVAMEAYFVGLAESKDRALSRRLVHGLMRDWALVKMILDASLNNPLKAKDRDCFFILAVALSELLSDREPPHAIVHSAVEATRLAKAHHLSKLVNAILRRFLRERASWLMQAKDNVSLRFGYPDWLIEALQQDWPKDWQRVLEAGNAPPPLTLRINRRHWRREEALATLQSAQLPFATIENLADAVVLERRQAIRDIPEFMAGGWSVQDASAQWVVDWLQLESGLRVLDACAGPGGKAAHCLERADVDLLALDVDQQRLNQVSAGFERLGLHGHCLVADAACPDDWWDGVPFDRILVDAPCSATGVIRRHPDIRWLRQAADLSALQQSQQRLLRGLWPLLKPGGILVYATCSVFSAENHRQVQHFLETHDDARALPAIQCSPQAPGRAMPVGWQILPGENDWDGFYFAAVGRVS